MTTPLLVDKNGQKFGKSEGNAYYLNESLTSREDMN
jgi:tyrosyl-tRNA synthetase